ncbi:MAG: acyl-CoA desaturase [Actinomycetota bacterium]|nr:acyl-CoA desaturase [Actinomycetota bacterium]
MTLSTQSQTAEATEPVQLNGLGMRITIAYFVVVPLLAVVAAIPVAWGGWLSWLDIALVFVMWVITALGITVGYHRFFTHGSFKAGRPVKIALALMGSLALEGSLDQWVADHRKHHKFSDEVGDPHSPWRFGTSRRQVAKGLYYAHVGWFFDSENTSIAKYAPDIAADKDLRALSRYFPAVVVTTLLLPALVGGLVTWSWMGALTAFFWAGLVRIALVHHVTWSINSICHVFGKRPFESRDLSSNVAWLAIPSMGESWHNLHHVDQTSARHGVLRGQIDVSAGIIRALEKLRLAHDVRWPKPERIAAKLKDPAMRARVRGLDKAAVSVGASA